MKSGDGGGSHRRRRWEMLRSYSTRRRRANKRRVDGEDRGAIKEEGELRRVDLTTTAGDGGDDDGDMFNA
ncbi:hypothetical protein NL676_038218 [Syzygium grande]|nr:hypothetical protein NL676_038218 [Syzygium grande]